MTIKHNVPRFVPILYFAYGSNLHQEQMKNRCPDSQPVARATAHDFSLTFRGNYRGNGVADIQPTKGRRVEGALYKVSWDDLIALDRYEGYPFLYQRQLISVSTKEGPVNAFVYRMNKGFHYQAPSNSYFDIIRQGYRDWAMAETPLLSARDRLSQPHHAAK
ncbi:gamma-glutamylcyclotransferase [Heliobacterium undosum]|uniref:Gamma-glutamylcyclotransferase n=1 Tax=Heliomicrobium undosum TaxID=121734 RepID=A0A845L168_9FIRM|nr:gamma-glutamylcyclotransferase family protein [Heliomicrobium undosum]MZP28699.1 gamma-glutamylcyclotransferase [Heliomicrobium undosum]